MRIPRALTIIVTLAGIAGCGGGGYPTTGDNGGGGGGAAGTVTIGSGIQFVSGRNTSMNAAVDTIAAGSTVSASDGSNYDATATHSDPSYDVPPVGNLALRATSHDAIPEIAP